ncbi:hypothetical protein ACHAXR_001675 [Thalassiosira sp. AJA248-18]
MQHPNQHPAPVGVGVPSFPQPPGPPPPSHPPLPPGWEQAIDPASGRPYYANRTSGETSWAPPPYFPPPPPPPVMQPQYAQQQSHHLHPEQPQLMHGSAQPQPVVAQPLAPTMVHNIPANNLMPMPSNYSQQFSPNQPQIETQPANLLLSANHNNPATQQQESLTAISHNSSSGLGPSTAASPGLLVPSVRAMIDAEYTHRSKGAPVPSLELEGLSAGAIADLCNVSREFKSRNIDGGDFAGALEGSNIGKQGGGAPDDEVDQYYSPLQPFFLPVSSNPPHIEPGRVDIRLHALHSKLAKI